MFGVNEQTAIAGQGRSTCADDDNADDDDNDKDDDVSVSVDDDGDGDDNGGAASNVQPLSSQYTSALSTLSSDSNTCTHVT
jgi:hypothetical protein